MFNLPSLGGGVPEIAYCAEVANWPAASKVLEEVVELINQHRSQGATPGNASNLRCAVQKHSKDMAERDYFTHDSLDGTTPWKQVELAGYPGTPTVKISRAVRLLMCFKR